jgi:transcriptional regulator with XRE-family HTH domain
MTADDFSAWVRMVATQRGWSRAQCARELGCGINQVAIWMRTGAPRYIALACASLAYGLPPWQPVDFRQPTPEPQPA